jgi:hypothetical protein
MDTIETIINSYHQITGAHIDWSSTAGMVWLVPALVGFTVLMVIGTAQADRQSRKRAIYREAQDVARERLDRWERRGYQEFIQTL